MKVRVMGAHLGQASGWDRVGDNQLVFYDFVPVPPLKNLFSKPGDLAVEFEFGELELVSECGIELYSYSFEEVLRALRKDEDPIEGST